MKSTKKKKEPQQPNTRKSGEKQEPEPESRYDE